MRSGTFVYKWNECSKMKNDPKNILNHSHKEVEQEKLLQYLNRNMTDAEQHEFEKEISEDPFAEDALEGLEQIEQKKELPFLTEQLNLHLKKEVTKRNKKRKSARGIPSQQWTYYAIVLILLIAVITYIVMKRL